MDRQSHQAYSLASSLFSLCWRETWFWTCSETDSGEPSDTSSSLTVSKWQNRPLSPQWFSHWCPLNRYTYFQNACIDSFLCILLLPDLKEELTESAYVNVLTRGDLSSLHWIASPLRHFVAGNPTVQLCHVYYSSLNFRDIMLATGKLPPDAIPGCEEIFPFFGCFLVGLVKITGTHK